MLEHLHGAPPEALVIAQTWTPVLVQKMLEAVWAGYDDLHQQMLSQANWSIRFENLERGLTEALYFFINRRLDAALSVSLWHSPGEEESRFSAQAQPPTYDMAFVSHGDMRLRWPLEAKVFHSDADTQQNLGDYVDTFNNRFMGCRYAPFSPSGAMLGYLISGQVSNVFAHLASRLSCTMTAYPGFPSRDHRVSDHQRVVPQDKPYPIDFQCHHLIMLLSNLASDTTQTSNRISETGGAGECVQ